jgi:hypothetical protein
MALKDKLSRFSIEGLLAGNYAAIDPFSNPVRLLHARVGLRGNPKLSFYSLPRRVDEQTLDLKTLIDSLPPDLAKILHDPRTGVIVVIPSEAFAFRSFTLPFPKPKEALKVAPLELEPRLLWELENTSVGLIPFSSAGSTRILAATLERSLVVSVKAALQEAFLSHALIECEGLARLRDLNAHPICKKTQAKEGGFLFLDVSTSGIHLGYSTQNRGSTVQYLPLKPLEDFDRLASEAMYILRGLLGELENPYPVVLRDQGGPLHKPLEESFGEGLILLDPNEAGVVDHAHHLRGALLGFIDSRPLPKFTTFADESSKTPWFFPQVRSLLKEGAILMGWVALMMAVFMGLSLMKMEATHKALLKHEEKLFRGAFPQVRPMINPLVQAKTLTLQEEETLKGYLGVIGPAPLGLTLEGLAESFQKAGSIKIYEASYRLGELRVLAIAPNTKNFERLKPILQKTSMFQDIRFENVRVQPGGVIFTVHLKLSPAL